MFNKKLIIQAIKNMPDRMPSDGETKEIRFFFKTVIGNIYKKRGLKPMTQLVIAGQEYTYNLNYEGKLLNEEEFVNVLFISLFSNEGWLEKHQDKFKDLNDDEVWKKFNNRAYKLLKDSLPTSYMADIFREAKPGEKIEYATRQPSDCVVTEYDEFGGVKNVRIEKAKPIKILAPELQWKKTELPPNVIEIVYEGSIPEKIDSDGNVITGLAAAEDRGVNPLELADRTGEPIRVRMRESNEKMDGGIMKNQGEKLPTFREFYDGIAHDVYNHPEIFYRLFESEYKDLPLIVRFLIVTFPSEEGFKAIYDRKGYLTDLLLKYGKEWMIILAKKAIKVEAQKKLKSRMSLREKQLAVKEMKEFYRKYMPGLRTEHIFQYSRSKLKKKEEDLDKTLQNFAHLLYGETLKEKIIPKKEYKDENSPHWKSGSISYWRRKSRKAWEEYHGRKIPPGGIIHHKDRNKKNIDPKNLELIVAESGQLKDSQGKHIHWHAQLRKLHKRSKRFLEELKSRESV